MNKITCDMCMDLLPLVKDGISSKDSSVAVEEHIAVCNRCKKIYDGYQGNQPPMPEKTEEAFKKAVQRMKFFLVVLMVFGIFFGLGLTAGEDMFYNSLIMPIVGIVGYMIFKWNAMWIVPLLMLITNVLSWLLALIRGVEHLDIASALMFTVIYSGFVAVGGLIAGLLHVAFRKE